MAKEPVYVSTIIMYSLAHDATDVMDNNNLATALIAQIQISITQVGRIRKLSIEPIILAKRWT